MTTTTLTTEPRTSRPARVFRAAVIAQPVWRAGVVAAVAGAITTEAFATLARLAGVPLEAANPGADAAAAIPPLGFAFGVLFWSVVGIVLAVVLARFAKRPARTFAVTTATMTVLSLAPPFMAPHTALSTQIVLALSHLVAAAVIIPALTVRLTHRRPAAS
ncbi:DUF6069 family protein [Streptomyces sp. NPDC058685]|uniref:DUF6069 family protein n=1 Tax=Streptomyces sp. NPDC058685 TaxID=3346598 RepID=UPI003659FABE